MMSKKKETLRLIVYLLFAFIPLWVVAILYFETGHAYEDAGTQLLLSLAMLMPAASVFIAGWICREKIDFVGENSLKLGISLRDKKWIWFLVAIFLPLVYKELGGWLFLAFQPGCFDTDVLAQAELPQEMLGVMPLYSVTSAVMISFGGLGEEIGWRGYMMPKLEKMMGIGPAIIVGGIIWGVWHFPVNYYGHNFGTGYWGEPWLGFLIFTVFTIAMNALLTLVTKKTGSVWAAAFMHAVNNGAVAISALCMNGEKLTGIWKESTVQTAVIMLPMLLMGIAAFVMLKKSEKKEVSGKATGSERQI